ncbi:hypothetical protein STFE110948_02985 [Streptobacillus felis]|uniref:NAD(P)-binding domain-containing protein n=1 Tax=Streptobacillus felis TaxID=1384509 RepID=UPI0039EC6CAC
MNVLIIGYGVITKGIIKNLIAKSNCNIYIYSKHQKGPNFINDINSLNNLNLYFKYIISCFKNDEEALNFIKNKELSNIFYNTIFIDLTTSSVKSILEKRNYIELKNGKFIECPFTGSKEGSDRGELILFAHIPIDLKENRELNKFLKCFCKDIFYFTEIQNPTKFKLIYNLWGAYILYSLKLFNPLKFDFNFEDMNICLKIVKKFGWMSLVSNSKLDIINNDDFNDINFKMEYMIKDIKYSLDYYKEFRENNVLKEMCNDYFNEFENKEKDFTVIAKLPEGRINDLKINQVLYEIKQISNKINFKEYSLIITGSISREDYRIKNGKIESDFDVLIIVKKIEFLKIIKEELDRQTSKINKKITFIFTLYENFINNFDKSYVRSINKKFILYDGLNLSDIIIKNKDELVYVDSILQEICYYISKYLYTREKYLLSKINSKFNLIGIKIEKLEIKESVIILMEFLENRVNSLNSIKIFQADINYVLCEYDKINIDIDIIKNFHYRIRENVFLENQGLSFEESIYIMKGSDENNS